MNLCPPLLKQQAMLNHARPDPWVMSSRRGGRGRSSQIAVTVPADSTSLPATEHQVVPTLLFLSLRSVESSLGKGLATFSLRGLPLGLVETIYEFVFSRGSRMAQMEVSKSLAPLLFEHVMTLDFSLGGTKCLGDSALLELATGCDSGLVHLNLNACGFVTDAGILGTILRCPAIRSLSLSGCGLISDEMAHHLPHRVPGLIKLNLAGIEGITASGVAYISFLPKLEKLSLARCKIGDAALTALGAGVCRHSLKWLDLTGTEIRDACAPSLQNMRLLEYVALSSTCISAMAVAALARDLRLPAALLEAPKTRARSNRALLMGSQWSEQQLLHAPRRAATTTPRQHRASFRYEHGSSRRDWVEGPSKAMRLMEASGGVRAVFSQAAGCPVKIGFREGDEGIKECGRKLIVDLVQGIVDLWPAVPVR